MSGRDIIVVGASAGGVEALVKLVKHIPADLPGTLFVVVHVPAESPSFLPQILSRSGPLEASHPTDGERIKRGHIYVAPPDYHMLVEEGYIRVVRGPRENRNRPSIDPLFRSAARAYGPRVVGIVLSGLLDDGTAGLLAIKRRNGLAIIQNPSEALYPNMPESARENVNIDYCLSLYEMGPLLGHLTTERIEEPEVSPVTEVLNEEVWSTEMETDSLNGGEPPGKPSVFSCPECGGVLWEIQDGPFLRFRCRTGHALSSESVLAEQTELVDKSLWTALKTLEEKVSLSRRLARHARERGKEALARHFLEGIQEIEEDARLLRHILLNPPLPEQPRENSNLDKNLPKEGS